MGVQWSFYAGDAAIAIASLRRQPLCSRQGRDRRQSALWFVNGDHAYQMEVEIEEPYASGGAGFSRNLRRLGVSSRNLRLQCTMDRTSARPALSVAVWTGSPRSSHRHARYARMVKGSGSIAPSICGLSPQNVATTSSASPGLYASGRVRCVFGTSVSRLP